MKISKRIIMVLLATVLILSFGTIITGCFPLTPGGDTAAVEGAEGAEGGVGAEGAESLVEEPTGFAGIFAKYGTWLWLGILVVAFYFLLIRPQRNRTKKAAELSASLQRGDEVVTVGGFHGRIKDIRDNVIIVTIASGVDVKVNKVSVSKKVTQ